MRGINLLPPEQRQEALKQSIAAHLRKAYLRMQLRNAALIPGLLKNYSPDYLAKYCAEIFVPSGNPEDERIQLLADQLIPLVYPDKKIEQIIFMTVPQIKDAYKAILKRGGGWSAHSTPEKRKTAVLDWYRHNQARPSYCLSCLKETYLQDPALYDDGGGQEKRNFIYRLVIMIVKADTGKELTFQKVDEHFKKLKKLIRQPLRLEDL